MEKVLCNLCGGDNTSDLYKENRFTAVLCNVCALGYLNPRMTAGEYAKHYEDDYQKARHNTDEYEKAIERLEKKGSYDQKKKHLSFLNNALKNSKAIFEVGSGWGTLLKVISDAYQLRAKGIEISSLAAKVAQAYYKLDVEQVLLEDYLVKKTGEKFDLVLMHHVFEHMLDPFKILLSLRNLLTEEGKLYLALPNLARPDEPTNKYFRIEHTYYFATETLEALLMKAGFKPVSKLICQNDMKFIFSKGEMPETPVSFDYAKSLIGRIRRRIALHRCFEVLKSVAKQMLRKAEN